MSLDLPAAKPIYLVSACLMGLCTRYDAKIVLNPQCSAFLKDSIWIPICPEQLGGLATPRPAADIVSGDGHAVLAGTARVCTKAGKDLSAAFINGARQVLNIAKSQCVQGICLKARSPSCAISGAMGVTAALLQQHGFTLHEF
jgi:uncharacterized protein YbbK (DUF523 family)